MEQDNHLPDRVVEGNGKAVTRSALISLLRPLTTPVAFAWLATPPTHPHHWSVDR